MIDSMLASGILLPFLGTTIGALTVYFGGRHISDRCRVALYGTASGVMSAASVFSLILPALESTVTRLPEPLPVLCGFFVGVAFLRWIGKALNAKKRPKQTKKTPVLSTAGLSIVLHNVPEGMAVGVAFAGAIAAGYESFAEPMALAVGIAIQNFPEGAIISLPLYADGQTKHRAFLLGMLSGIVEPIAALLTLFTARRIAVLLPYCLGFAAGAMTDAVTGELLPDMGKENAPLGSLFFSVGFCLMMTLDVVFS